MKSGCFDRLIEVYGNPETLNNAAIDSLPENPILYRSQIFCTDLDQVMAVISSTVSVRASETGVKASKTCAADLISVESAAEIRHMASRQANYWNFQI